MKVLGNPTTKNASRSAIYRYRLWTSAKEQHTGNSPVLFRIPLCPSDKLSMTQLRLDLITVCLVHQSRPSLAKICVFLFVWLAGESWHTCTLGTILLEVKRKSGWLKAKNVNTNFRWSFRTIWWPIAEMWNTNPPGLFNWKRDEIIMINT